MYTQYWSTKIYESDINRRGLIVTIIVGHFNIISMGRLIIHTENQHGNTVEHIKPNGIN